jgi:hypothetical protein
MNPGAPWAHTEGQLITELLQSLKNSGSTPSFWQFMDILRQQNKSDDRICT